MAFFLAPLLAGAASAAGASAVASAAIGAGANLVGGALNRRAQRKANKANSPAAQVAAWEAAGINPIEGITKGQWIPQQAASIGDAFASAGAVIQRGLELDHEEKLRETELEKQNEELKDALDKLVRSGGPSYMSQYGGIVPTPTLGDYRGEVPNSVAGSSLGESTAELEAGPATVTSPLDRGSGGYVNPRVLDAEASEARNGDLMQEYAGARVVIKDNLYNSRLQNLVRLHGRDFANRVHSEYAAPPYHRSLDQVIEAVRIDMQYGGILGSVPIPNTHTATIGELSDFLENRKR